MMKLKVHKCQSLLSAVLVDLTEMATTYSLLNIYFRYDRNKVQFILNVER